MRLNNTDRGYDHRWGVYARGRDDRGGFLGDHPLCVRCLAGGAARPSRCVDHIIPVRDASDPLFYCESNHQALCLRCHSLKTAYEDVLIKRLVLTNDERRRLLDEMLSICGDGPIIWTEESIQTALDRMGVLRWLGGTSQRR